MTSPMLDLDDPKTRFLLGMASGLLQSGGASARPVGIGEGLATGYQQGAQQYDISRHMQQEADMRKAQVALRDAQIAKMNQDMQRQRQRSEIMGGTSGGFAAAGGSAAAGGPWSPQYAAANAPTPWADLEEKGKKLIAADFIDDGKKMIEAAKILKDRLEMKDGVWYDKFTGAPVRGGHSINQQGFGSQMNVGPDGAVSMSALPGSDARYATQQRIGEEAKAALDPYTVGATSPTSQPYVTSRLNILGGPQAGQTGQGGVPNLAQQAGRTPTGMSPAVAAAQQAAAAQQTDVSKNYGEMFNNLQKAAAANDEKIANLKRIDQLLGDFEGGKLSGLGLEIASAANSVNVKFDKQLGNKQAAEAVANEISLANRSTASGGGMPGAMSDADREFLRSMTPQMAQSADGRKKIIEARIKVLERQNHVAGMARAYQEKNGVIDGKFYTELQSWSNKYPIFGK